jgi:hypothetical protein
LFTSKLEKIFIYITLINELDDAVHYFFDYAQFGVGVREELILVPPINIKIFNQIFSRLKKNFQLQNHSIASGVFCDLSAATVGTRWHRAGDASPSMLKPV